MSGKINLRILLTIIISLIDDAIFIAVLFLVLSWFGVMMPVWLIILLASIFTIITYFIYRILKKTPLLGFDDMTGKTGTAVSEIARKGTIKIGNELWYAETNGEHIETGKEVIVVSQTGLKLTVTSKNPENPVKRPTLQ
jgi:membrane-bound ClpP family serine protease